VNELQRIIARTREELVARKQQRPLSVLTPLAEQRLAVDPPRPCAAALAVPGLSVIAEHKRRSPSAGVIREGLEIEDVVTAYERGGARALSVLTEHVGFGGALEDLGRARRAVTLPILRKDFIVDPYQVTEAIAAGADAILLIVAALAPPDLATLHARASDAGLGVLVEVHDAAELEVATALELSGQRIIGINNRDLTTLAVDVERTFELRDAVPTDAIVVSESGLRTAADLDRVAAAGIDAVLVGESLMRADDVQAAARGLTTRLR
jgi:indole-3-glycerol phosphate synthase